jgi:hypothetical protein
MAYQYAYPGPPFHWLGNVSKTQWTTFKTWATQRKGDAASISLLHRIKAEQLRKTAGVMEQYYSSVYPNEAGSYGETLAPTFQKTPWKPGTSGHFNYTYGDDQLPMVMVSRVKGNMKEMVQRHEDAVYTMNQIRCMIEKHEDTAQYINDFVQDSTGVTNNPMTLTELLAKVDSYFTKSEYQNVLVNDTVLYKRQPYFRVHPADLPTQWELEQANHSDPSVAISIVDRGVVTA